MISLRIISKIVRAPSVSDFEAKGDALFPHDGPVSCSERAMVVKIDLVSISAGVLLGRPTHSSFLIGEHI